MPHPAVRGVRRPVALLAFLWLIISVVGHHSSLAGDAVRTSTSPSMSMSMSMPMSMSMSMASMPRTMTVHEAADQSSARPDAAHTSHIQSGHPQSGHAQSGHAHDGGAACCSSYDVRSEQLVPPPALLGHTRAPHHTAPPVPGHVPAPGPSPPDPASLSVLRI
ncbi:hypothetical protein [Streptomyces sp. S186]|uniref:hypothetical protein n=1 Tax=Streptomyces sp. S186 TaxID=3434395 RepID=UPI003F6673E2